MELTLIGLLNREPYQTQPILILWHAELPSILCRF